ANKAYNVIIDIEQNTQIARGLRDEKGKPIDVVRMLPKEWEEAETAEEQRKLEAAAPKIKALKTQIYKNIRGVGIVMEEEVIQNTSIVTLTGLARGAFKEDRK